MHIRTVLKRIYYGFKVRFNAFKQTHIDYKIIVQNSFETANTPNKLLTGIILQTHAIEKGLSYKNPKIGFGHQRVLSLISNIENYLRKNGENHYLHWSYKALLSYVEFNTSNNHEDVEMKNRIMKIGNFLKINYKEEIHGGVNGFVTEKIEQSFNIDFKEFLISRHSVRHFKDESVNIQQLEHAIDVAKYSPSACNRQCWRVHIFRGKRKCQEILNFQGGARGMSDELSTILLITGDMNRFHSETSHQPYIDGSLYAMTLIYTLHSMNIATLALNASFNAKRRKKLYLNFNIPKNEVPIMFIGIGYYPSKFNAPISFRNPWRNFTTLHNES